MWKSRGIPNAGRDFSPRHNPLGVDKDKATRGSRMVTTLLDFLV